MPAPTLETPLSECFRLTASQKAALEKLNIHTAGDLLAYFPSRYEDISDVRLIKDAVVGKTAVVYAKITDIKTKKAYRSKVPMAEATVADETGTLKVTWFHQPYMARLLARDSIVKLVGKVSEQKSGRYMANPETEQVQNMPFDATGSLFEQTGETTIYPVYPERKGVSSRWVYHHIRSLLADNITKHAVDPIPEHIREKYALPSLGTALVWIHAPRTTRDYEAARKRFAFQEIFLIQLSRIRLRNAYQRKPATAAVISQDDIAAFLDRFPFSPTGAQTRAIDQIVNDLSGDTPMTRLLEGDVGSGKTLVAAATSYAVAHTKAPDGPGRLQVAYMAPTEILARQQFEDFISYFSHLPIQIALVTGSECRKFPSKVSPDQHTHISRNQVLKWIANGEIGIVIGTHALIQEKVTFKRLAYVIIDEQHRFGVMQRKKLAQKRTDENTPVPHLLSMTATPIPRTLALTLFGDLDLTVLDEMPQGRKPIQTYIVAPRQREDIYEHIRKEIAEGRQVYVICPRIDEPDPDKEKALNAKSVTAEAKRLKKDIFPEYTIDTAHSKMTSAAKEKAMEKFADGETDILVATSVVEVGVNVPNATVIIIEGAERFGLSQLHQLRGRVLRSSHQAYCYLFSDTENKTSLDRLKALQQSRTGFELAEQDLQLRGAGQLAGGKQWGVSDIGMDAIRNIKMVEAAREEAGTLLEHDPELLQHPLLKTHLTEENASVHFE